MKLLWSLLLIPVLTFGQSVPNGGAVLPGQIWTTPQWNTAWKSKYDLAAGGTTINARTVGLVCDGATDNGPVITAINGMLTAGTQLYFPPAINTCLTSVALSLLSGVTVYAVPGTVILKPFPGNISNPVLLNVAGVSNVTVQGIIFDGGGASFANQNPVIQLFQSTNTALDRIAVQNTRGIGILGSSVAASGVTNSFFNNIGMFWQTSLLVADRHQAIAFCCSSTIPPQKNYAINNYFTNIGLDALSFTAQTDLLVANNRCFLKLVTPQFITLPAATNWPACVFLDNNTASSIIGNVSDSAPGNGFDIGPGVGHSNLVMNDNYALNSGSAGIAIATTTNFSVVGNQMENNGQNTAHNCFLGGLTFNGTNANGSVVGNTMTDTQGSKTQSFGIYGINGCSLTTTLVNVWIDQNNSVVGNLTGAYGGSITGPTLSNLGLSGTYTGNWTYTPASGTAITINNGTGVGINLVPSGAVNSFTISAPSTVVAQMALKANGNGGAAALLIQQDVSSNANFINDANANMTFATNNVTRATIPASGGLLVTPVAIASLPTCNGSTNIGVHATVNNGVAGPTYMATVSTTGVVTDPVYCNGTNWVYD